MPLVQGVGDEVLYALIAVFGIPLWLLRSSPHLRVSLLSLFRSTPPHATRSISSNQNLGGTAIPSGTNAAAATATAGVTGSGGVGPASGLGPAVGVGPARGFGPASGVFQAEGIGAAAEAAARAAATTGGGGGAAVEAARAGGEAMAAGSEPRPPEGEMCCVCHDAFALPTQANCGHWFCGESTLVNAGQLWSTLVNSETSRIVRPPEGEMCCVCHDAFALPIQANCGHWFCGESTLVNAGQL
ncbi:unnamed protein product [Closterium sp. NIES-54]